MMENMNIMNENIVLKFMEQEGQERKLTISEKNLIEANTKLVDENRILKSELKKTYKIIDRAKDYIEEKGRLKYVPDELLKILEGDEYEK